jgi:hypothetical protein
VENRLKAACASMPDSQHELLDIICAHKQFSFMNSSDPNWIKWVLGPVVENSDKSQTNFSQEYEFIQALMAYLDFRCEKRVFSPSLENPRTLHYCAVSIADATGWETDSPMAKKIPNCEAWVELPPPCSSENKKVFIENHVFFENVRIGINQLSLEK